jgi:hypothetical protein
LADARERKQCAKRGQHLRQYRSPTDGVEEAAAFFDRRERRRP